ncbi:hypothetical protein [Streptomyces coeruleofuscus]|uniref:Uncharacterized protein n=1 Tax=Streptomyces coeruleofuscus TaxID=66879 RepID=A0ABP5WHB8_9ACTN
MSEAGEPRYQAAWVPYAPDRDLGEAVALAAGWTDSQCEPGTVWAFLTSGFNVDADQVPGLARFTSRYRQTTPKAGNPPRGPLMAYLPDLRMMCTAHRLAQETSVAVVEAGDVALSGWAAMARAVDLTHPNVPPVGLDPQLAEAIEQLHFYGHNAYSDDFGRARAKDILVGLHRNALLDRAFILSALLARGASLAALEDLGKLIGSVGSQ